MNAKSDLQSDVALECVKCGSVDGCDMEGHPESTCGPYVPVQSEVVLVLPGYEAIWATHDGDGEWWQVQDGEITWAHRIFVPVGESAARIEANA